MPLPEMSGFIAGLLQYLGDGDFSLEQMRVVEVILQDTINARSQVLPSGQ
jgi:hypothetical protein